MDNVFIDVVEPIDPTLLAPSEKELERWWARQNSHGRGTGGAFDFNLSEPAEATEGATRTRAIAGV